jgi:flavin-dependent dehydrogenase
MNTPGRCDVVIVGGGPAGSMAATFLAQKGYDAVLLEKQKHPRYMVGESLIPQFWKYCDLAQVSGKILAEGFVQKQGGTVIWDGVIRQAAFRDFGYTRPALHIERDRFDLILLDHARSCGARIFEQVTATDVNVDHSGQATVTCRVAGGDADERIACRFVIDASGQSALIGRKLGIREHDDEYPFMSVWGYFTNSRYVALDGRAHDFAELPKTPPTTFVSSTGNWGWCWHIPLREITSVGLVVPLEQMKNEKAGDEALQAYFLRRCAEIPYLNRLLEPAKYCEGSLHVLRPYSYRPKRLCGPGFFLIGDAAAFIDPVLSEGCLLAMYSAHMAAWTIDRSLRDTSRTTEYQALFTRQFATRYQVGHALMLTGYGDAGKVNGSTASSLRFDSDRERELMYVALTMAGRAENLMRMLKPEDRRRVAVNKFRTLPSIGF